jgi:diacylglycerol kinase (ATP)
MNAKFEPTKRSWPRKFAAAGRGVWLGIRGQKSFLVHVPAAVAVVVAGALLGVSRIEWCILSICITIVLVAELLNSALESIAKAIDDNYNQRLADSLDIASGAVLIAAIGAAATGAIVFLSHAGNLFGWW